MVTIKIDTKNVPGENLPVKRDTSSLNRGETDAAKYFITVIYNASIIKTIIKEITQNLMLYLSLTKYLKKSPTKNIKIIQASVLTHAFVGVTKPTTINIMKQIMRKNLYFFSFR